MGPSQVVTHNFESNPLPLPTYHCCCCHFDPHGHNSTNAAPLLIMFSSQSSSFLPNSNRSLVPLHFFLSPRPPLFLGTPPAPQSGEERFAVVLDAQDDVWLEVLSISRPANILSLLLLPLARHQQRAFARGATARLRALAQGQRTDESGKDV